MKIMAIDYGKKRAGIALTDPLGIIAQPLLTISYKSERELIQRLKCLCAENNVGLILVGNPHRADGSASEMSEEVKRFARKLKKVLAIDVQFWDERYTSKLAQGFLKEYGIKSKDLDRIAASLMLEEYLRWKGNVNSKC
ncbi:MAG: Holliday junction resolvase RuvX [candidate division WOR-3 bacterium]